MAELPDIEALSQEIATIHLQGDLISDTKRIRRVTLAQLLNAPEMGPPHHRLRIGGKECKYIELVANVPDVVPGKTGLRFTLDDGFGRLHAWLPRDATDNPKQKSAIASLRPFDYAHIEGRVHRPPDHSTPIFRIISIRRVSSPYEIYLHLLQTLAEIDETVTAWGDKEVPESASALLANSPAKAGSSKRIKLRRVPEADSPKLPQPTADPEPQVAPAGTRRKGKARASFAPPHDDPQGRESSFPQETPRKRSSPRGKSESQMKTPPALRSHPQYLAPRILRYFRSNSALATRPQGIAVNDSKFADYLKEEEGIDTDSISLDDIREAMDILMQRNYLYMIKMEDEFHYGLVTQSSKS